MKNILEIDNGDDGKQYKGAEDPELYTLYT